MQICGYVSGFEGCFDDDSKSHYEETTFRGENPNITYLDAGTYEHEEDGMLMFSMLSLFLTKPWLCRLLSHPETCL